MVVYMDNVSVEKNDVKVVCKSNFYVFDYA